MSESLRGLARTRLMVRTVLPTQLSPFQRNCLDMVAFSPRLEVLVLELDVHQKYMLSCICNKRVRHKRSIYCSGLQLEMQGLLHNTLTGIGI